LSGAIPFRLVRSDLMHSVDGSLCPMHPDADDTTFVSRRCPLFMDIRTMISMERRRRYFLERQLVHSSSAACDEPFLEILHMRRFDWTKCCIDIAVPMFRLRQLSLSQLAVANRIILDKHFETNVGKRSGSPHQCPLCNDGNLNIFHVLLYCSHGLVSHVRYTHTLLILESLEDLSGLSFAQGLAFLDLISADSLAANLLRGVVPDGIHERINGDMRLSVPWDSVKNRFNKFLAAVGARTSAVYASFLRVLYESRAPPLLGVETKTPSLRRADGSLVRKRRRKLPNLFTMEQFKPPPKQVVALDVAPSMISCVLIAASECGSYRLAVDFSIREDTIDAHLAIEDLSPGCILLSNEVADAFTIQVGDPCGGRQMATYGSDIGYSGYVMLHSVLGDQEAIDTADIRNLKALRQFIDTMRCLTSDKSLLEELDGLLQYMRGVGGCCHSSLPETWGMWLGATEVRQFAGTDDIMIWSHEPAGLMHYTSGEKLSLARIKRFDLLDHVLIRKRMFWKFFPPTQDDINLLLQDLSRKVCIFLRAHLSKSLDIQSLAGLRSLSL